MSLTRRLALQFALTAALATSVALGASLAAFALRFDAMGESVAARFEGALADRLQAEAEATLETFAAEAAPLLAEEDRLGLARLAMETRMATGAARVRVYDFEGRTLANGEADPAAFERPAPALLRRLDDPRAVRRWREEDALFAGRALCADETCFGAAAVAIDGSELAGVRAEAGAALWEAERRFWTEAGAYAGAGIAAGALVAALIGLVIARRLSRSLAAAVRALERVAEGESGVTVEERRAELAELSHAVEKVAEAMESTRPDAQAAVVADMADGLLVTDEAGVITLANPALGELLGLDEADLIGTSALDLFGTTAAHGAESVAAALAAVERYRRGDGETLTLMVSAKPTKTGATAGVVAVARDVGGRFAETGALADARKRADAAEKAKSEFLSVVSHELRTPLNGILGGAAVLAGTELNEAQRGFLGIVQKSGQSMLSMVSGMLDFAREEEEVGETGPVDLEEVAHAIARGVSDKAREKGLDLHVRVQPGAPIVMTDGDALVEIGGHLADNAVKFSEVGSVGVSIASKPLPGGRAEITLSVDDDGPGVPADERAALFEPFAQGDSSERRRHSGAGLGLSIAQKLAKRLGGELSVGDAEGGGAVFTLVAPAPLAEGPSPRAKRELSGARALVVEANPDAARALKDQLEYAGADATLTDDAASAAAMLREAQEAGRPLDLVVHDERALHGAGSDELREWVEGEGWADGVASVALRPEGAPEPEGERPARMRSVSRPARLAELVSAAGSALTAAKRFAAAAAEGASAAPAALTGGGAPEAEEAAERPIVLLADPNEVNRIVLAAWLDKAGYRCVVAQTGVEALKRFKSEPPVLVLMDVGMPAMSGVEVAKAMRGHEEAVGASPAPIVGLVGKERETEREHCAAAGMNDFLSKPVKTAELEAKLERWTALYGAADDAAAAAG